MSVTKYGATWRYRFDAGVKPDGGRDQRSRGGFRTKREALEAEDEARRQVRDGLRLDVSKITVGQYLDTWLISKRSLRATTRRTYEGHIRVYLRPLIGGLPLASLRADHLDAMFEDIRSGRLRRAPGIATTRRIHSTLRVALHDAHRRRLIPVNPATQVDLEPEPLRQRDVWTPSQLATFLDATEADPLGTALRVACLTGLRRGELCGLRWQDVDIDRSQLTIEQQLVQSGRELIFGLPKTRKGIRVVSIDPETVAALKRHRAAQAEQRLLMGPAYNTHDLVFCREDGSPLRPDAVSRRFIALTEAVGLPRIVLHGLRHSHATAALAAGVEVTVVSARLGHSRSSFTADTYMRVLREVDQAAATTVADAIKHARGSGSADSP